MEDDSNPWDMLPSEIEQLILLAQTKWEDRFVCRFVCKRWHDLISTSVEIASRKTDRFICKLAARGYLDLLRWSRQQGCPWKAYTNVKKAARRGHLHVLKWIHSVYRNTSMLCYSEAAARGGHLKIVRWLEDKDSCWREGSVLGAVKGGHVDLLSWLVLEKGCGNAVQPGHHGRHAAQRGHLRVLEFMHEQGFFPRHDEEDPPWSVGRQIPEDLCEAAAEGGHLEVMEWTRRHLGATIGTRTASSAIYGGHPHLLDWILNNSSTRTLRGRDLFMAASGAGSIEALEWAQRKDFAAFDGGAWPLCEETIRRHPENVLEVLEWLVRRHGASSSWGPACWHEAAQGKNPVYVLDWAVAQGFEVPLHLLSLWAVQYENAPLLEWARVHGCMWGEALCARTVETFWRQGRCRLQWLREQGCPWDATTCAQAARAGNLEALEWARQNGCPWDASVFDAALEGRYYHVAKWLYDNGCPASRDAKVMFWGMKLGLRGNYGPRRR